MFKKIFHWKTLLISMSAISVLFIAMVFFFNTAMGEVIYSKIFPGNILVKGNIYVADHTSGNQGTTTSITGLPKLKLVALGALTTANTETVEYLDDSPTGEWTAVGTPVTLTADTDIYRAGANSLKVAFTSAAVAGNGAIGTIGANDDLEANESIGFWIYSTERLIAAEFYIQTVDATNTTNFSLPAISAKKWTWVEIDISGLVPGDGDIVTDLNFLMAASGATNHGAFNIYLDAMYKWDADDEEALGVDIVSDGVLSVLMSIEASGTNNVVIQAVEHTNYFTHYEATNDFIVGITDNNAYDGLAFVAYK